MTVSIYARDDAGNITDYGPSDRYANEGSYLLLYGLTGIEPRTERVAGQRHSYVKWYDRPTEASHPALERWPENCAAIGSGLCYGMGILQIPIADEKSARAYIDHLHATGKLYHFDDSPETVVRADTGARTFSDDECAHVGRRAAELFNIPGFDPFEYSLSL